MPTNPSRPGPGRRPVQAVTTARVSVEKDRAKRMWEYLAAMGFRLVAFPVSVWMLMNGVVVAGIILAAVAVIVPSVAVVLANNVDRRGTSSRPERVTRPEARLGPGTTAAPRGPTGHDVEGTVVSSHDTPYPGTHHPAEPTDEGPTDEGPTDEGPTDEDRRREAS